MTPPKNSLLDTAVERLRTATARHNRFVVSLLHDEAEALINEVESHEAAVEGFRERLEQARVTALEAENLAITETRRVATVRDALYAVDWEEPESFGPALRQIADTVGWRIPERSW